MTKREALRQTEQERALMSLGFTREEANQLRRISTTLHRWYELECGVVNGGVERDETTGKPVWYNAITGKRTPYPDRETGAVKRLKAIIDARNDRGKCHPIEPCQCSYCIPVSYYLQTDPRGAALYILRPGDVPDGGDVSAYYSRGICVY